jgi:hypothetical protein
VNHQRFLIRITGLILWPFGLIAIEPYLGDLRNYLRPFVPISWLIAIGLIFAYTGRDKYVAPLYAAIGGIGIVILFGMISVFMWFFYAQYTYWSGPLF